MQTSGNKMPAALTDKVAATIANQIIKIQCRCSVWLNSWFNTFTASQKKRIVVGFGLFVSVLLITNLFFSYNTFPELSRTFSGRAGRPVQLPKR